MNCSRVCALAFGKSASAASRAAWFSSVDVALHLQEGVEIPRVRDLRVPGLGRRSSLLPNGEPPVGGSKMPLTVNVSVVPFGNVISTVEPTSRSLSSATRLVDERTVVAEVRETSCEPVFPVQVDDAREPSGRRRW